MRGRVRYGLFYPSYSRQQSEQDMRSYARDDQQKILEEEAKALEQFNKVC